jgi:hypothetical protein
VNDADDQRPHTLVQTEAADGPIRQGFAAQLFAYLFGRPPCADPTASSKAAFNFLHDPGEIEHTEKDQHKGNAEFHG